MNEYQESSYDYHEGVLQDFSEQNISKKSIWGEVNNATQSKEKRDIQR